MDDVVFRLLRELPDTDKDRYDIAYTRGRAQARSSLLFGGMAIGLAAGAVGLFLLDPVVGGGRRAKLAQRVKTALGDLQRTIAGRSRDLRNGVDRSEAAAATEAATTAPRYEVRTAPRSAAASVTRREDASDRVPVGAGTAER